jgi:hypothetical protein
VAVLSNLGVLAYIKHSEIRKMNNQMLLAAKKNAHLKFLQKELDNQLIYNIFACTFFLPFDMHVRSFIPSRYQFLQIGFLKEIFIQTSINSFKGLAIYIVTKRASRTCMRHNK